MLRVRIGRWREAKSIREGGCGVGYRVNLGVLGLSFFNLRVRDGRGPLQAHAGPRGLPVQLLWAENGKLAFSATLNLPALNLDGAAHLPWTGGHWPPPSCLASQFF
jgi:hypothetical protein